MADLGDAIWRGMVNASKLEHRRQRMAALPQVANTRCRRYLRRCRPVIWSGTSAVG